MKRLLPIFLLLSACTAPKPIALKGNYEGPRIIETTSSFDQVWDKLIDLFAQKGLSIKIIDRSSGLIVSERSLLSATTETNAGPLKNPEAFAVEPKIYDRYSKKYKPVYSSLTGEWNVRIKRNNDKTVINVNIVNIEGHGLTTMNMKVTPPIVKCAECKSTGVFEKAISDLIK